MYTLMQNKIQWEINNIHQTFIEHLKVLYERTCDAQPTYTEKNDFCYDVIQLKVE